MKKYSLVRKGTREGRPPKGAPPTPPPSVLTMHDASKPIRKLVGFCKDCDDALPCKTKDSERITLICQANAYDDRDPLALSWPDGFVIRVAPDFGCVQWKAKED